MEQNLLGRTTSSPKQESQVSSAPPTELLFQAHQPRGNLAATAAVAVASASQVVTTMAALPEAPELTETESDVVSVVAALKLELMLYPPPGFLTPEYVQSEGLLDFYTAENQSLTFTQLGTIYKRLSVLMDSIQT